MQNSLIAKLLRDTIVFPDSANSVTMRPVEPRYGDFSEISHKILYPAIDSHRRTLLGTHHRFAPRLLAISGFCDRSMNKLHE